MVRRLPTAGLRVEIDARVREDWVQDSRGPAAEECRTCWWSAIAKRRMAPCRCAAGAAAISDRSSVEAFIADAASRGREQGEVVIAFEPRGMRGPRRDDRVRINERIRVREVRVIDETGQQLGIMAPQDAIRIARIEGPGPRRGLGDGRAAGLPHHRLRPLSVHRAEAARQARKHQKTIEVKEIKFRPKVDEHDYQFKKKHIERFLAEGDKVKATVFFRGREIAHPEIGRRILERLIQEVSARSRWRRTFRAWRATRCTRSSARGRRPPRSRRPVRPAADGCAASARGPSGRYPGAAPAPAAPAAPATPTSPVRGDT